MDDVAKNLETLRKLAVVERGHAVGNAGDQFKVIAGRLAYLQQKAKASDGKFTGRWYLEEEIDALFWLLAHHEIATKLDVRARFSGFGASRTVDFERYEAVLSHVKEGLARAAPRMLAA